MNNPPSSKHPVPGLFIYYNKTFVFVSDQTLILWPQWVSSSWALLLSMCAPRSASWHWGCSSSWSRSPTSTSSTAWPCAAWRRGTTWRTSRRRSGSPWRTGSPTMPCKDWSPSHFPQRQNKSPAGETLAVEIKRCMLCFGLNYSGLRWKKKKNNQVETRWAIVSCFLVSLFHAW